MDVIVGNSLVATPGKAVSMTGGGSGGALTSSSASRSLRVRTSSQSGKYNDGGALSEIQLCPSVMSEDTKKMLPPTTETIQTKPFPIRGESPLAGLCCVQKLTSTTGK